MKPIDDTKAKPYKRVIAINLPAELQSIDTVTCKSAFIMDC